MPGGSFKGSLIGFRKALKHGLLASTGTIPIVVPLVGLVATAIAGRVAGGGLVLVANGYGACIVGRLVVLLWDVS